MPRLPEGVTWPVVGVMLVAVVAGLWISGKFTERRRVLALLESHAQQHPEDGNIVKVLSGCQRHLMVDVNACGKELVSSFGPEVMNRLAKMQAEGAFGRQVAY